MSNGANVEAGPIGKYKNTVSTVVVLGKDVVALFRDMALFILALLLLLFPSTLNTVLTNAGFEEGSLAGFKWKKGLVASNDALSEAQTTIDNLKTQLEKTTQALNDAQSKITDPGFKNQLAQLEQENKQLSTTSNDVKDTVDQTLKKNASLVETAKSNIQSSDKWGVVYGTDNALDKAQYESQTIASKYGIPNAAVYFRQGVFRSVSVVDGKNEAEQALSKAKQRRSDAYIVKMSSWCPEARANSGYFECVSP